MEQPQVSALYARKSVKDGGRSAARQERDWRLDCAAQGFVCGPDFVDPDLSASRFSHKPRPGYLDLLAHLKTGESDMVSLWEASRGSRQLHEWIGFIDMCRDAGILIRIFGEGGHTYDPRRRRDYRDLVNEGLEAHDESSRLSERVTVGIRDAATQGRPGGHTPYGYTRTYGAIEGDDDRPRRREIVQVIDPDEAAIIRRMVEDTLADRPVSMRAQARRLNGEGVPTPSGTGQWSGQNITRLLLKPALVGDRAHNGVVVARDVWPAIISREERRQLERVLRSPQRLAAAEGPRALMYQLVGAALCGSCRGVLRSWRTKAGGQVRYLCRRVGCGAVSAPAVRMDEVVDRIVRARLRRDDVAELFVPAADTTQERQQIEQEIADIRQHIDDHIALAAARKLSAVALAAVESSGEADIERLNRRLRDLSRPPALRHLADIDVAGTWPDLPAVVRREVIQALAVVVLSPVGHAGRWSPWRLGESRWHGDELTWGQRWERDGVPRQV